LKAEGYNPSLELAFRIAGYFGKDINEIFFVEGEYKDEKN
jgi:DNA-binding XRE family transcriptional regulator